MVKYHIVGQGIAGTVLAMELLRRGETLIISNDPTLSNSSRTAAGLFNPLVFKKLSKTWMAEDVFPAAEHFYKRAEEQLKASLYHELPLLRVFGTEFEAKDWEIKKTIPEIAQYIQEENNDTAAQHFNRGFGTGWVKHAGYVDTNVFLTEAKKLFESQTIYREQKTDYNSIHPSGDGWICNDIESEHIIFCEGWLGKMNPFFSWLPFNPAKGNVLHIRKKDLNLSCIVNGGVFILPTGNHEFRVGATFSWDEFNDLPTEKGKKELCDKLHALLDSDFEIVTQMAGVRPATIDRRPFLGSHPTEKGIHIFNGLGTRGVVLAPYLSRIMADFLNENKALPEDVDIRRHTKTV